MIIEVLIDENDVSGMFGRRALHVFDRSRRGRDINNVTVTEATSVVLSFLCQRSIWNLFLAEIPFSSRM